MSPVVEFVHRELPLNTRIINGLCVQNVIKLRDEICFMRSQTGGIVGWRVLTAAFNATSRNGGGGT